MLKKLTFSLIVLKRKTKQHIVICHDDNTAQHNNKNDENVVEIYFIFY